MGDKGRWAYKYMHKLNPSIMGGGVNTYIYSFSLFHTHTHTHTHIYDVTRDHFLSGVVLNSKFFFS